MEEHGSWGFVVVAREELPGRTAVCRRADGRCEGGTEDGSGAENRVCCVFWQAG